MKRSVKAAACICALIMAATSVSAVTAYADDSAQASVTAQADTKKPKVGNVRIGKVTAVNGSEITVALGGYTKPEKSAGTDDDAAGSTTTGKKVKSGKKQKVKSADSTESTADTTAADSTATGKKVRSGRKQKVKYADSAAAAADETADSASGKTQESTEEKPEKKESKASAEDKDESKKGGDSVLDDILDMFGDS